MSRLPELSPWPLRYALACLPLFACSDSDTTQARPTTPPQASPPSLAAVQHPAQPAIVRPLPPQEPSGSRVPSGAALPKPAPSAPALSDLRGDFCGFVRLALTMPQLPPRDRTAEHISPAIALAARAQLKNTPLAIALAFFFGPLGLLYSSPGWAMILTLLSIPVALVTVGLGLIPLWMAALVVAALSSERHNKQIIALAKRASQRPAG